MLGLPSKCSDTAPPYDELDTIREPDNANGYFAVPKDDTEPAQGPIDEEQPHDNAHHYRSLSKTDCRDCLLPPPRTFQPHMHCDICDGFLTRQQRMRTERFYCGMVAATVMFALLCGLILGVTLACTRGRRY